MGETSKKKRVLFLVHFIVYEFKCKGNQVFNLKIDLKKLIICRSYKIYEVGS